MAASSTSADVGNAAGASVNWAMGEPSASPCRPARAGRAAALRAAWRNPRPPPWSRPPRPVPPVAADGATPEGQKALFAACPEPDILVTTSAGPPPRDFRTLTRQQMLDGVVANMVSAIEIIQGAVDSMVAKKFGRIVAITSAGGRMPPTGLELSC